MGPLKVSNQVLFSLVPIESDFFQICRHHIQNVSLFYYTVVKPMWYHQVASKHKPCVTAMHFKLEEQWCIHASSEKDAAAMCPARGTA